MSRPNQYKRPTADEWHRLVDIPRPKSPKTPKPAPQNKRPRTYTFSRVWKYTSRTAAVIAISVIFILALVYVWPNLIAQEPASSSNPARLPSDSPTNQPTTPPTGHSRNVSLSNRSTSNQKSNGSANNNDPLSSNPHSAQSALANYLHRGVRIVRKQIPRRGASQSPEQCTKHHRRRLENPRRTESDRRGKMSRSNNRGPSTVPTRNQPTRSSRTKPSGPNHRNLRALQRNTRREPEREPTKTGSMEP